VVHEKEAIAPITQASEIDRIHLELVALYENEMITELKQKCIMYMSK
jgi:hypothetical protein